MKEHNDNEYKDEKNKFDINDEDVIENYDLENDFEPEDEIRLDENDSEFEFEPRDESEYRSLKKSRRDKSHYHNVRKELNKYLDSILKNYPENIREDKILSMNKLADKFNVSKPFVIDFLNNYIKLRYTKQEMMRIKKDLWPQGSLVNKIKREKFYQILPECIENFPNDISKIPSLQDFADMINVERNTITNWIKKYLLREFGSEESAIRFKEIWTNRQGGQNVRLKYEKLKNFIRNRRGTLLTSKEQFDSMKFPSQQHIEIVCEENHTFSPQILHILYHNQWCPTCKEYFCQKITRLYMEAIFDAEFPETSLKNAYGLPAEEGGQLRWDGYNNKVSVKGEIFRISFEYDGLQHDRWPNWIHKSWEDFKKQQENDQKKNVIAGLSDYNTVVIRLKEINGFNKKTINKFQTEILKQFYEQTGIKYPFDYDLDYDPFTNSLKLKKGGLENFLG